MEQKKFYDDGLKFKCIGCHQCCRHTPGYVFLSEEDIERFCSHLKLKRSKFIDKYCRTVFVENKVKISLIEKPNFDCIFWNQGCTAYEGRPTQCRTYPFWTENLKSQNDWQEESKHCPGIGMGEIVPKDAILAQLKAYKKALNEME